MSTRTFYILREPRRLRESRAAARAQVTSSTTLTTGDRVNSRLLRLAVQERSEPLVSHQMLRSRHRLRRDHMCAGSFSPHPFPRGANRSSLETLYSLTLPQAPGYCKLRASMLRTPLASFRSGDHLLGLLLSSIASSGIAPFRCRASQSRTIAGEIRAIILASSRCQGEKIYRNDGRSTTWKP